MIKIKGSKELGGWADMPTICKKELDITPFIEAQSTKEHLDLSMPFTAKSGFNSAGCPQMQASITAQMADAKVTVHAMASCTVRAHTAVTDIFCMRVLCEARCGSVHRCFHFCPVWPSTLQSTVSCEHDVHTQDASAMSATLKERQASQSSNPPLDLPDDIASGLSSDEEEAPSNEPEHLPEDTFLIQQPAAAQSQPDNAFSRLPCMVESIFKCCLGNMLWQEMHRGVSFHVSHLQGHCCMMDDS